MHRLAIIWSNFTLQVAYFHLIEAYTFSGCLQLIAAIAKLLFAFAWFVAKQMSVT